MTDIVERLSHRSPFDSSHSVILKQEATTEITRLRAERDEALNQLDSARHSVEVLEKRNAQLLAKVAKADALADALESSGNVTERHCRAMNALTAYRETDK